MLNLTPLQRYKSLIDDWPAFSTCLQQALPTTLWVNTQRVDGSALQQIFQADGIGLQPINWQKNAFRLPQLDKPGHHWSYLAGLYHIQEEVSMLPVHLLNPQPGERILDLCAAPGNKTAQIALKLQHSGTVIANDISHQRMRGLHHSLNRLGLYNVSTTIEDAANYPKAAGAFDRILLDAPCSCEGTLRKSPRALKRVSPQSIERMSRVQQAMLRRAVQLCKPGGRIVYSTCTFAPEENERVVNHVLQEFGTSALKLLPINLPHFHITAGLTVWQDERYDDSLALAGRIWPHHNDTGGFFVAILEKQTAVSTLPPSPALSLRESWAQLSQPLESDPWLAMLADRFGIAPDSFSQYRLLKRNVENLHLSWHLQQPPLINSLESVGTAFMRTKMPHPKLSTATALHFGPLATRNIVSLTRPQSEAYLQRQDIRLSPEQTASCTSMGYVILTHQDFALGAGLYLPPDNTNAALVRSLYPKAWAK